MPEDTGAPALHEIQMTLPKENCAAIQQMMAELGLKTLQDTVNSALTLLEWCKNESLMGRMLASYDPDTDEIIQKFSFACLDFAAANAQPANQQRPPRSKTVLTLVHSSERKDGG